MFTHMLSHSSDNDDDDDDDDDDDATAIWPNQSKKEKNIVKIQFVNEL